MHEDLAVLDLGGLHPAGGEPRVPDPGEAAALGAEPGQKTVLHVEVLQEHGWIQGEQRRFNIKQQN